MNFIINTMSIFTEMLWYFIESEKKTNIDAGNGLRFLRTGVLLRHLRTVI